MKKIKTIILDVDGTLTDGKIYYGSDGRETKAFNIKDGLVIAAMGQLGYLFIVVTGRKSEIVEKRMTELGVINVYQGIGEKRKFITEYLSKHNLKYNDIAYLGDDINDLSIMKQVGFKGCPADASEQVKKVADFVSAKNGGDGAAREILEKLLKENNDWDKFVKMYE